MGSGIFYVFKTYHNQCLWIEFVNFSEEMFASLLMGLSFFDKVIGRTSETLKSSTPVKMGSFYVKKYAFWVLLLNLISILDGGVTNSFSFPQLFLGNH